MSQPSPRSHGSARQRQRRRSAFTLLEVIVAVTIVALLATLVVPRLMGQIGRSKRNIAKAEVASIAQQVKLYLVDNGMTQVPNDFALELLMGEYLENADDLVDPWGKPYLIFVPGQYNTDFDIISYARDGEPGGAGEDEDVINGRP